MENLSTDNKSEDDSGEIPTESGRFFFQHTLGVDFSFEGEGSDRDGDSINEEQEDKEE